MIEGFVAVFLSSLVLVVVSIGLFPVRMVLAFAAGLAVASTAAYYLYEVLGARLRR